MSTPINNKDTAFNQAWDNLNQGGFQADQSYGRPKIQAVNPHNMMSGAQSSYKNHQAYKDISNSTSVPSITTTRPLLPAQTPLMECYSWHNNNNKQHETITINSAQCYPQNPQTNGAQFYPQNPQTNGAQFYPQTSSGELVVNNAPYGHRYTASTSSLPNNSYQTSTASPQIQHTYSQTKRTDSPLTTLIRCFQTPKEKTPALTGNLPNLQPKSSTNATKPAPVQAGLTSSAQASLEWKNISLPAEFPFMQVRHQELRQVGDVMLPEPPSVTNAEEAKKLLRKEFDNQLQEIDMLWIVEQYEHTKSCGLTNTCIPIKGSRKNEFKRDLELQLENGNLKIDQCHTPEDINKAFQDQWISMKKQGVYRHWCLRQTAPDNPLPHYPGRVSVQSGERSGAADSSILQLLHSGTMNYFIFRTIPTEGETVRDENNDYKNNADHQKEWQRLYQAILFGSKNGGLIEVPQWICSDFRNDGPAYKNLNSYHGTFFDKNIVWKAVEPLRGLDDPQTDTRSRLEWRILDDWRACRLYIHGHYTTLIKDKDGKITSVDRGMVGHKTYNNSKELLDLFVAGKKPYDNPSFIEFGE